MRRFIKENKHLVIFILVISTLFPIIILWESPFPDVIPKDIGIAIVGYGGSIIGGFLTLYGVWWTIKKQEEDRLMNKELELMPYLHFILRGKDNENSQYPIISSIAVSNESSKARPLLGFFFYLYNVGRGEAFNINIYRIVLNVKDYRSIIIEQESEIPFLSDKLSAQFVVLIHDKVLEALLQTKSEELEIKIEIWVKFQDINKNTHTECISYSTNQLVINNSTDRHSPKLLAIYEHSIPELKMIDSK